MASLALGIAANVVSFAVLDELAFRPLHIKDPETLLGLVLFDRSGDRSSQDIPLPIFKEYQQRASASLSIAGYAPLGTKLHLNGAWIPIQAQLVSGNYFSLVGLRPTLGTFFTPSEDATPLQAPLAVLSHRCWIKHFGGRADIIGKTTILKQPKKEHSFTIIGVAPPTFTGLEQFTPDVWIPSCMEPIFKDSQQVSFRMVARLAGDKVSRLQTQHQLDEITRELGTRYHGAPLPGYPHEGGFQKDLRARLISAGRGTLGPFQPTSRSWTASVVMAVAVGLGLLVACANVANLILVRGLRRRHEIGVKLSLGASRARLMGEFATESILLTIAGGIFGLILAGWAGKSVPLLYGSFFNFPLHVTLEPRVIIFTLFLVIVTSLLSGLVPAWQASLVDVSSALKSGAQTEWTKHRLFNLRGILVTTQIGVSLLLLFGAGLAARSFGKLNSVDTGFNNRDLVIIPINLEDQGIAPELARSLYRVIAERFEGLPGVKSVSFSDGFPLSGRGLSSEPVKTLEGYELRSGEELVIHTMEVGPTFFETIGVALVESQGPGRGTRVLVNQSFLRRFWAGKPGFGRRVGMFPLPVTGIVRDFLCDDLRTPPKPIRFVQQDVPSGLSFTLVVRTKLPPDTVLPSLLRELRSVHSVFGSASAQTVRQLIGQSLETEHLVTVTLAAFSAVSTFFACLGLYGVISYLVLHRTREIGIRIALGAARSQILKLILGQGFLYAAGGSALGIAGIFAFSRLFGTLLFGVSPGDPATVFTVALALWSAILIACYLPARRAASIEPMLAIRTV